MSILSRVTARVGSVFKASAGPFNLGSGSGSQSAYTTVGSGARSRGWNPPNFGPNLALDYSATALRNQSRDLIRKNPVAAAALEKIVSNTIGTGIKPQLTDKALNALWVRWTDESAIDGQNDFYGQQSQIMRSVVESGECFVRSRIRKRSAGLAVPLQIEVLEAEFVPHEMNGNADSGNPIRQGIEFDKDMPSLKVAYWIYPHHPADALFSKEVNLPIRVPAYEIDHIYRQNRPGQIRGEPWLARILDTLLDLDAYQRAELVRKKTAAMYAGFIRRATPEGMSLDDLTEMWGEADEMGGVGMVSMEPGSMQILAPGEDIEFSDPKDNSGAYEIYIRNSHRQIAASLGLLYEDLSGDFSQVNDRTWRAASNGFRRLVATWQHQLIAHQLCRPLYRRWAMLASLQGVKVDPNFVPLWMPQAWAYINPVQDVEAISAEIRAGLTSRSAAIASRGDDIEEIDAQQAADNARADSLGLKYESDAREVPEAQIVEPEVEEDEPEAPLPFKTFARKN